LSAIKIHHNGGLQDSAKDQGNWPPWVKVRCHCALAYNVTKSQLFSELYF